MKALLLAFAFCFAFSAQAEGKCVAKEEAQKLAFEFLDKNGEAEFEFTFKDKTVSEKLALITEKSAGLSLWKWEDSTGHDWIVNMYAEESNNHIYEEYLVVYCSGNVRKFVQQKQD